MKKTEKLKKVIEEALTEKLFLKQMKMSASEMRDFLKAGDLNRVLEELSDSTGENGRFIYREGLKALMPYLSKLSDPPQDGWLEDAYNYVLDKLFPTRRRGSDDETESPAKGRLFLLQTFKALHRYETDVLPFDPTIDMDFLTAAEVKANGYTEEYLNMKRLADTGYLYETMRIGTEITPYNTLGHIAGVHYVAMYLARQLAALKVPVDLALVSGAAAGHDIGKYGCSESEEKRVPYLHYYYTDMCFNRFDMPMIGHIAANHSTWDLELDNLSVESLLLIYADFRVKSRRDDMGREAVHFYSLDQSFDVILNKLDNVDSEKEHRYRRVYNKLKDFEDYAKDLGADVSLPDPPVKAPRLPQPSEKKDYALLRSDRVVEELKYLSIEHNINLMNKFYNQEAFADFMETARSEKQWKSLRTYVSIFGEYSTYMTEKQKLMTIRFLTELLVHRESDIRHQAGVVIGKIIARFNEEYRKEIPEGADLPRKEVTNGSVWRDLLGRILLPDHRLTAQHKIWLENSLRSIVFALFSECRDDQRTMYLDEMLAWYDRDDLTENSTVALLKMAMQIDSSFCTEEQRARFLAFAEKFISIPGSGINVAAASVISHFGGEAGRAGYIPELKRCLGYDPDSRLTKEELSEIYLDNLKAGTPWPVKIANIRLMLDNLMDSDEADQALHVATHLGNLVKVSETVAVRRRAGEALVSIMNKLPLSQRNEIAVEMGKGLEIGDYQFSNYIPDYLGVIMLHLPPRELDELILDLEKLLEANNGQVAAAVLHTFGIITENYRMYGDLFGHMETEKERLARKYRLVSLIIRGFANYNDVISQEALWTIGMNIFGSGRLSLEEKYDIFCHCGKRILTLYENRREGELEFFNNAAVLKHIYRFICEYELEVGEFAIEEIRRIAFFPGTFDPFSLSHKAIATEIRNKGYEVYLALDEFSWSKKTQPRLQRRKILSMSVSDEENIYPFPDDIPINIANPRDLGRLREIFRGKELYFVAGDDVVENASCYRQPPVKDSIHSMNHIIIQRSWDGDRIGSGAMMPYPITGNVINLRLEEHFEDISSTRIRENIDSGRDISNLIDPVAQNYIFDNSLYMREPAYKHVMQAGGIYLSKFTTGDPSPLVDLKPALEEQGYDPDAVTSYLKRDDVNMIYIRDGKRDNRVVALAAVNRLDSIDLLSAFGDQDIAAYIRKMAAGTIAVIGGLFFTEESSISNLDQTILVEMLSELLARDYTYVVYHPCHRAGLREKSVEVVKRQGFINIAPEGADPIYAVNARSPVIIFKNVDTVIKEPLSKSRAVLSAVEDAHQRLLAVLRRIYPGELVISYNAGIMYYKIIHLLTKKNSVSPAPYEKKIYGKYMAVPFGKLLEGSAVPNTVTKSLHTEKYFNRDVTGFSIEESGFYSTIENQIRTIKSFNRPVILVDDLLHKGYRMRSIDPILKEIGVDVIDTVVGVQTGRGRDLMTLKERNVDSAYFLPNLKCWIDESDIYPYIGGDGVKETGVAIADHDFIASMNLILPFAVPTFLGDVPREIFYDFSMTCLKNAESILKTLEEEYQRVFERKLTLNRLGEVITDPKNPNISAHISMDQNMAPSTFVGTDIERLVRIKKLFG